MAKFSKSVLKVGETMQSPDGPVVITAERLKHFSDQHRRVMAAGYDVPSRWEHADKPEDMLPLSTEEFEKQLDGRHTVGRMVDFRLAPGGQQAEMLFDISDSRAVEQCEANRVKVSPVIAAWWRDGRGNEYQDFISHADLVQRPVDYSQGNFERVDETNASFIACSTEVKTLSAKVVRMALEDLKKGDDKEEAGDKGEEKPEAPAEPAATENPDMPPATGVNPKVEALIAGLATLGVVVPSDWTPDGDAGIDILLGCINSSIATKQQAEIKPQEEPDGDDEPVTVSSPGFATMSAEKNPAYMLLQRKYREGLVKDIDAALKEGRISPHEARQHKTAVSTVRMSLDNKGNEVPGDVEKFLQSRSADQFKGLFFDPESKTRLSAEVAELPDNMKGPPSGDDADKAAVEQLRAAGFKVK